MPARDARVDDRHADAGAVISPLLLRRAGADRDRRAVVVPRDRTVEVDAQHFRALGDLLDDTVRQLDGHAVDELEATPEAAAELLDFLLRVGFLTRLDREDHLGGAEQPARARPRFLVELFEPLLPAGVLVRARLARPPLGRRAGLGGHRDRERDEHRQHECRGLPRKLTLSRTHLDLSFGYLPNLGSGHNRLPLDTRLHAGGGSMIRGHQCTAAPQTALARRQSSRTIDQSAWS